MKRRSLIKAFTLTASIAAMGMTWTVQAAETIKVGILHSLSGTMAISETSLKDMALMTIDEINAKGGVNGKMLEPVVVDPASNWPLFAEKGYTLTMDKTNHHLHKPVMIGEIQSDGQFNVVWQTEGPVRAQPWSPFIQGND